MADFEIRRGDTAPIYSVTLKDRTGTPVDLTSATNIQFVMRLASAASNSTPHVTAAMTKATQSGGTIGQVSYDWQTGDTNLAGSFLAEHVVTWGSGKKQTFPTAGGVTITVHDDYEFHTGPGQLVNADPTWARSVAADRAARAAATRSVGGTPRAIALDNDADVKAWLTIKCAAATAPILTSGELDKLVEYAKTPSGGYRVNRAAAEGWLWKAGKASGGFSFAADGTQVDKTMIADQCLRMAQFFSKKGGVRTVVVDSALVTP
jgi:hypothetical protein